MLKFFSYNIAMEKLSREKEQATFRLQLIFCKLQYLLPECLISRCMIKKQTNKQTNVVFHFAFIFAAIVIPR